VRAYRDARPLTVLLFIVGLLVAGTALAREMVARFGFLVERQVILVVWLVGLLVGTAIFAWVARRSVCRAESARAFWLLGLTAVALASPLLMILLQHPSP
jgi:hypothetical protein